MESWFMVLWVWVEFSPVMLLLDKGCSLLLAMVAAVFGRELFLASSTPLMKLNLLTFLGVFMEFLVSEVSLSSPFC